MPDPEQIHRNYIGLPLRYFLAIAGFSLVVISALFVFPEFFRHSQASVRGSNPEENILGAFPVVVPTVKYGFALDTFQTVEGEVQRGQILGQLLSQYGLSAQGIETLFQRSQGVFRVQDFQTGKPYLLMSKNLDKGLDYLVYEPSLYEYFVFHLKDSLWIEHVERPVETRTQLAEGTIESSLWQAMEANGASPALITKLEDALQWSIDFHHLQQGDYFRALYDQQFVEETEVDPGKVHAALYRTGGKEHYAIYYEHGDEKGYYDLQGRPMNKGFLKAPVRFSRISSHFNMSRFHPILKRVRPHFGTDYAAPYGTENLAVGKGEVIEASYSSGNGNYVKIRHNKQITTQYLHMQRFAKGIRRGTKVRQGQVIGYVGSTGLATGPHVCFRFWMNGKQVNHLRLSFPPPDPWPKEELGKFFQYRDALLTQLNHPGDKAAQPETKGVLTSP